MRAAITLGQEAAQQVLEAAVRTQAAIMLELSGSPGATVNGLLISGDDRALLLEVTDREPPSVESLLNAEGRATVFGEARYYFSTVVTDAPRYGRSALLAISRPSTVSVLERRQFARARLAPSSRVNIRWRLGDLEHSHDAVLLNIAAEGLACRLETDTPSAIKPGSRVAATFELPGQQGKFSLDAAVMNTVPSGDGGVILGLRFLDNARALEQLTVLRSFLEKTVNSRRAEEACV